MARTEHPSMPCSISSPTKARFLVLPLPSSCRHSPSNKFRERRPPQRMKLCCRRPSQRWTQRKAMGAGEEHAGQANIRVDLPVGSPS